ncbi:MAG TPA: nucleotidyltransferase domain-containing protein [Candidatus Tripitaka californicus]|uniref:nucleotidyltransferase domain-containing protein n=1 Tax=Candidatus Tripitaka californicus TaxID=3367616 RepID=UPI00402A574D
MYNDIESTLKDLTASLCKELKGVVRSIILYGSVARKQATEDSDIDILVVMPDDMKAYRKLSAISYDIDLKNSTVTSAIPFTPEELNTLVNDGSPFIEDVLTEGVILYDDGTFQELRTKMLGTSRCACKS